MLQYSQNTFAAFHKCFHYQYLLDKQFKYNSAEKIYEIEKSSDQDVGTLTSLSTPDSPEKETEMLSALELTPIFQKAKQIFPKSPWIYYTSKDFIYMYPYVPAKDFKFSKEILDQEFYKYNLPEVNPNQKVIWTNPYYDLAGQGMMITKSLPVYKNKAFLGTLSIDVKLSDIRSGLNLWYYQLGNLYIVNNKGVLISSNNAELNSLKVVQQIYNEKQLSFFKSNGYSFEKDGKFYFYKILEKNNFIVSYEVPKVVFYSHIITHQFIALVALVIFSVVFFWWWLEEKMQIQFEADNIYKNKLISLAEMSGGIAHEINNPLTVIQGRAAQSLKKINRNDFSIEEIKSNLDKIVYSTDRISKIISALKNFSRNDSTNEMQISKLTDLVNDTLFLCENRIHNEETKLIIEAIPDIKIRCHGYQIIQILINLINNSFDATSSLEDKWINISFQREDSVIKILVTDSGHGISPSIQNKIFEPFYTTKPINYGTGLGLSISKKIAINHLGDLSIDTRCPNTRFVLVLPISQEK